MTPDGKVRDFSIDKGSSHDSKILDKILHKKTLKLPYELFLDKGYEKYERRRKLKKRNCQLRIEMKKQAKNKKRGPRFLFTREHKKIRSGVEKFFAYLKSFNVFKFCRFHTLKALKMHILAVLFIFTLSHH